MELAIGHYLLDLFHVGEIAGEVGRQEFSRVVALEPAGLVTHPRVAGSMRLVESVLGELLPVLPDFVQSLFGMPVGLPLAHELVLEDHHLVYLLLAHGLAQAVRLALGESRQLAGEQHHLLLIDCNAVCFSKKLFHLRQVVLYLLYSLLALHKIGNVIHGARTIEGVHSYEVLEALGLEALQPTLHAFRFKLEHYGGVSPAVKFKRRLVRDVYGFYIDVYSVPLLDRTQGFMDDGEGYQAQEIHLQHAHVLYVMPVILRCPQILAGVFVLGKADGDVVGQVATSDDGGAGVHSHLTHAAFKFLGVAEHFLVDVGAVFELVPEFRHEAVAVGQGNLGVNLLHTLLECTFLLDAVYFNLFFYHLEARFQLVQLWVEGVFLLHLLAKAVRNHL